MSVCMPNADIFQVLLLDWRPLTRDAFFYGISIVMFSAFAWDGKPCYVIVTLLCNCNVISPF